MHTIYYFLHTGVMSELNLFPPVEELRNIITIDFYRKPFLEFSTSKYLILNKTINIIL